MSEADARASEDVGAGIERLCASHGIAVEYMDVAGKRHRAAPQALRALLAEFDVDVESVESVRREQVKAHATGWYEILSPVVTAAAGAAEWHFRLRLPAAVCQLEWTLQLEDGSSHRGSFITQALELIAAEELNGILWHEYQVTIAVALPLGYHYLSLDRPPREALIIAAPPRCYVPLVFMEPERRVWGITAQLYSLRSKRNWGIGDFSSLRGLIEHSSALGADMIGLNPLHALFPQQPERASPYSPSSRLGLNVLYIDVEATTDFLECESVRSRVDSALFQARLESLREARFVDYAGVAAVKFEILEALYAWFRKVHLSMQTPRAHEFRAFQTQAGERLRMQALYEALSMHFSAAADSTLADWRQWPDEYRDCNSPAVRHFAAENIERLEYYEYLQWLAQQQLRQAAELCHACGMALGLYLDLAVSVDRGGADAWMNAADFAPTATVGAPPDEFNPNGQNWGLPPLRPARLRQTGYRLFRDTLRAVMAHAAAIRIDHVMGLMRLFWIPAGATARDGAYVHYQLDELADIVALESVRNRCMVVGEDLGTVADELRLALTQRGILSYRMLYFERTARGEFKAPSEYPANALAAVSTHDLATLAGWWSGTDLDKRMALELYPDRTVYETQRDERKHDRRRLLWVLEQAGLLSTTSAQQAMWSESLLPPLVEAVHAFVAATPSLVMSVQLEDALGVVEQVNMPGTADAPPNWRRKLPATLEKIAVNPAIAALAEVLRHCRPHASSVPPAP